MFTANPPEDLRRSCEFLRYQKANGKEDCILDFAVYGRGQLWRTLYSEKLGTGRPLVPSVGSSDKVEDHLVGIYSTVPTASALKPCSTDLLVAYTRPAGGARARGESQRPQPRTAVAIRAQYADERPQPVSPLTQVECDRLLKRYQRDHPGASIARAPEHLGGTIFAVHFDVPEPYCWIAGRAHQSPGNSCGYLVYDRAHPSKALYRCHAGDCSGTGSHGQRLQRVLLLDGDHIESWTEEYELVGRMRAYPVPDLSPGATPLTTMVMANMGAGKSKALLQKLLPKIPPSASICIIAPNIALADKYLEDTKAQEPGFVSYRDENLTGRITSKRVIVCVNPLPRVLPRFDLVVLDEVNFTLTNMASTVMKDNKKVFFALEGIVASAKAAFLCDAHLNNPRVVEWVQALRPDSKFHNIRNTGVWPTERKAEILPMPGPLKGRGQPAATFSCIIEEILDHVADGKKVMVPATSKTFVELLEADFTRRFPDNSKTIIAFHGGKRGGKDKALLRDAIRHPDKALLADVLTFTPTIGPGVSIEKKQSYDLVIGVAVNSDNHPDAQVMMQQIHRARDAGDIRVFYGELKGSQKVVYPGDKEEVFRRLEADDECLADMMKEVGSTDHLDMIRGKSGERAIYDRNSPACNLYANNILGRAESRHRYPELLVEDMRRQGLAVSDFTGFKSVDHRPEAEDVQMEAEEELTVEEWRSKHLISYDTFEDIQRRLSKDVSPVEVLNYNIWERAITEYGVMYANLDQDFAKTYVTGKQAESLRNKFLNYRRFVTSDFETQSRSLPDAVREGEEQRNIQDYLEFRNQPSNGVAYAWAILAALQGVAPEEVDNGVLLSTPYLVSEKKLLQVFDMPRFRIVSL
ncbi:hypothetical protein KFL_005100080, partial [Klebsormidium nitens]